MTTLGDDILNKWFLLASFWFFASVQQSVAGFEPGSSGVGNNCSFKCATTTAIGDDVID